MTRPTRPIGELLAGGGRAPTTCPHCERDHAFLTSNSYLTASKGRRRLRQCRFCGHATHETVPAPVPDDQEGEP